jgi:DHA1 family multidrug resistance protein-like MFS transporter
MTSHPSVQTPATNWKRTLYIVFFAQMVAVAGFLVTVPFLPLYVEELGTNTNLSTELLAGLTYSAQAFTMAIASPIWGALADRYGRKLMVERAMFGGTVVLLLMGFVQSAEQLVLLRAVQGMITGTISAANALVAANTPREHTGYAMGLLQVGMGIGVAVGPLIGGAIADAVGYAAAFYATAALLFIGGVLVWWGVEEHFEPPEALKTEAKSLVAEWRHVLSSPGIPVTYGLRFLSQLGQMMIFPIAPLFILTLLSETGRINTFTGLVVGSAALATTVSAIYLGRLGDRVGHRRILITSALLAALFYLPQSLVTAGWQLLVLQALVGVCMGGLLPSISALLARYSEPGEEGAVYGLEHSITSAARAVAPLLGAAVAGWFGLRATFVAAAFIYLVAGATARLGLKPARAAD